MSLLSYNKNTNINLSMKGVHSLMYGLVLEGGGARGAYHMGAYKALIEGGFKIGGVAGTSVGALNGAMIAQGDHEKAYEIWHEISYSKIIAADEEEIRRLRQMKLDREDISLLRHRIKEVLHDRGLDITPLKELIWELVDEDRIRNSGMDFGIVTVSITDLKPLEIYIEDIPNGRLAEYLMASAYLPVFKRERIDGKSFIDGAIYNNLPANLMINKGYKDLIMIRTNGMGIIKKVNLKGINVMLISPNEDLGGTLNFDRDTVRYNLKLGYYDGLKAIKGLKGHNYYIEALEDEDYFVNYLLNLEEQKVNQLKGLFRIDEDIPCKRALFEFIIPKLSTILEIKKDANYENIFFGLLEKLASIYNVEKFQIYTYYQLLDLVKQRINVQEDKETKIVDKIIDKVNFLLLLGREEIIKKTGEIIL